ncbi:MAG: hypothetical protein U5L74_05225 [Ideonella sp.]|nr:hypothetical protein [Ideonella sp.]
MCNPIGVRNPPRPNGRAGWVRIDSVHQGDLDGVKGVYHITCVDSVSQWQVEACVQGISEPFCYRCWRRYWRSSRLSLRASIRTTARSTSITRRRQVAENPSCALSRPNHAPAKQRQRFLLAESKNASVVRKHMGYSHIPQKYAKPINKFYEGVFIRGSICTVRCLYATGVVSDQGKVKKVYKSRDAKTPLERLVQLNERGLVTFKPGTKLDDLVAQANAKTDLQAAQEMQKAKADLFELFNKLRRKLQA